MIYDLEDYQFTAGLLRQHAREDKPALFQAVCSNNINIILDALDLVAVVPDLLAALKAVVSVADRKTDEFDQARAAIARAEGATP